MRRVIVLLGLLISFPLPGQDRAATKPDSTKPLLVLEMDGPDALRQGILPTNVGTMLASQDARGIWPELWNRFNRAWYGKGEQEPLLGYAGRIRVLAFIEPGRPQRERGVVILEPDGKTSTTRLAEELSTMLRSTAPGAPVDREAGGLRVQTVHMDPAGTITFPVEIDDRLVSFFGRDDEMDWVVTEGLRSLAGLPPVSGDEPALSLKLDLAQVAVLARADAGGSEELIEQLYGLASLRELEVVVRPAGPRILAEVGVQFGDGTRGIFDGLMPEVGEQPTLASQVPLASLVPADSQWLSGHLGIDSLVRTAITFLAVAFRHGAAPDDPLAEAREELRRELGFDLFDELLAHLGDEVMVVRRPGSIPAGARIDDYFSGLCLAVAVRKSELVEANLLKLLEKMDLRRPKAGTKYRGVAVRELPYPDGSGSAYFAVTPELLLFGFDDEGRKLLEEMLAARTSGSGDVPMAVRRAMRQAPLGLNGMGVVSLRTTLGFGLPLLGEVIGLRLRGVGPEVPLELLERYGLGDVVVFTGYRDNRWRLRLLW